jgi:phosphoribosylamine--glycine ligase
VQIVEQTVLQPVIDTLRNNGHEFIGLLYAGLVLTKEGIKVIEFNARFGDPETQVLIPRLKTPLAQLLYAAATEDLSKYAQLDWIEESAVTVVLASENYPAEPIINREITGLTNLANQLVFHAGTKTSNGKVISSGGRVLAATGLGESMEVARENAYQLLGKISLVGGHFRKDIALKKIDPAS